MLTALSAVLPLATDDPEGGFHTPSIAEFFPAAIFGAGTPLEFNRIMLVRVIAAVVIIVLFLYLARGAKLIPNRKQGLLEMGLDMVRTQIAEDVLGDKARKYLPMLTTIFFAILFFNLTGLIPGLNIAATSRIGLPVLFALWVYVIYLVDGVKVHGLGGFFKTQLFPAGMPKVLYLLITPIEFLQVFVLRPATLAVRLAANMIAGHIMLVLCFAATHFFFFEAAGALKAVGAVSLLAGLIFTLFELLVAVLQAYVFALLAAAYISLTTSHDH